MNALAAQMNQPSNSSPWEQFDISQYLFSGNELFIEEMFQLYRRDPEQVSEEWRHFFKGFDDSQARSHPSWAEDTSGIIGVLDPEEKKEVAAKQKELTAQDDVAILSSISALQLIHAYRVRGHLRAKLDPLGAG